MPSNMTGSTGIEEEEEEEDDMFTTIKTGLHRTIRALRNFDRGSMRGSELLFPYAHARPRPRDTAPAERSHRAT